MTVTDQAREVLLRQKELSGEDPIREIKIDNLDGSFTKEALKFVFTNSLHGELWRGGHYFNKMFFREHLERCGLEYRGGNQARHTFGSMMVTQGLL